MIYLYISLAVFLFFILNGIFCWKDSEDSFQEILGDMTDGHEPLAMFLMVLALFVLALVWPISVVTIILLKARSRALKEKA